MANLLVYNSKMNYWNLVKEALIQPPPPATHQLSNSPPQLTYPTQQLSNSVTQQLSNSPPQLSNSPPQLKEDK
jgi:hypothetical protein